MIYFNDVCMLDVAPVKIADIVVSPIQMTVTARQRPYNWGAQYVRTVGGSRTVEITFAVLERDKTARMAHFRALTEWARNNSGTPGKLELPGTDGLFLECACTSLPDISIRQWWESKLRIVFSTFDNPYWTDATWKTCACDTAFTVLGDAPPIMQIRHTLSSAQGGLTYGRGTEIMQFSGNISAGDLVIDLNRQTAQDNGNPIMARFVRTSTFLTPKTGTQTIEGTGTIYWRERWE